MKCKEQQEIFKFLYFVYRSNTFYEYFFYFEGNQNEINIFQK